MLLQQGEARSELIDRRLACLLAAIAGALNTAAFHAVGFFSANMTGNVSSLSDHAAQGEWGQGWFYLSIILAFVLGATISTLLINGGRRRGMRSIYAVSILAEAVLMASLGLAEVFVPSMGRGALLILGLSFLMGIQNAVVTRISNARVRTTHVSGMATDLGIELGMLLDMFRGKEPAAEAASYKNKLKLHLQTVLAFLAGGVFGVLVYHAIGTKLLFVAAGLLLALAGNAIVRSRLMASRLSAG